MIYLSDQSISYQFILSCKNKFYLLNRQFDFSISTGLLALGFQRYGNEELLKLDPLLQLFKVSGKRHLYEVTNIMDQFWGYLKLLILNCTHF